MTINYYIFGSSVFATDEMLASEESYWDR